MQLKPFRLSLGLASACLLAAPSLHAQTPPASTLERINQTGTIRLGYRENSAPLSYMDSQTGKPIGYSVDLCLKVVEALRKQPGAPHNLNVEWVPVTSSNRIAAVQNGRVDLECGVTTNNKERRQLVSFAIPTFIAHTRLLVRSDSDIQSIRDLRNRTVVTTRGTSSEQLFTEYSRERALNARLNLGQSDREAFAQIESNQAQAFVMDDVLLYTLRAGSAQPANYRITGEKISIEPLALMLRKDDPGFKKVVDGEIRRLIQQGDIYAIYQRWFQSPIPPKGLNLDLPMSYLLRDSFKAPTDWTPDYL
jgi:glutamate/aspartate transport system substrate-binding protein